MGCKYVKEFDFGTKGKDGSVKYAMGGKVQAPRVEAMDKREMAATPTMRRESAMASRKVQTPARRGVPVAAREPMIAMKVGGKVSQAKVGRVMGEFKAGELHSGSKTGPVVKNPKQAVAIALSEGRKAAKR